MICKQCNQAFNGTAGICHLCGTVHSEPVKIVYASNPEPIPEKEVETPKPEKKKKGAKP